MKITTWRSAAERCDNRAGDVNGPSIKGLRAAAVAAAVHITCWCELQPKSRLVWRLQSYWPPSRARVIGVTDENLLIVETLSCLKLLNFTTASVPDEVSSCGVPVRLHR